MESEMDLKALWNKQQTSEIPHTKELLARAGSIKRRARNKLLWLNLILAATSIFILYVGFTIEHIETTTIVGIALVVVAMISYLVVYDQIIPILFKHQLHQSSQEYLQQLILIKRKQEFINRVMLKIYFALLSVGLLLYMMQFSAKLSLIAAIAYYGLTFGWLCIAWFYLAPRTHRRKQQPILDMIARLERVNDHLQGE